MRPATLRLLDRMTDLPVMVFDAKGDVLAWNAMAIALHGDFTALPVEQRNIIRRQFPRSSRRCRSGCDRAGDAATGGRDTRAGPAAAGLDIVTDGPEDGVAG